MQQILPFQPQSLCLKPSLSSHQSSIRDLSLCNNSAPTHQWKFSKSHLFLRPSDLSHPNLLYLSPLQEFPKPTLVISARKNRRRTTLRISRKMALEFTLFVATNLKLLPEPVNLIIKEGFGGGKGGGFGSWNGFGGGEYEGWWRGRRRKFGNLGIFLVICALLLLLIFGKELQGLSDLVLGLGVLGFLNRGRRRGVKGWILGFFSCSLMVLLGLRREELQKGVLGIRVRPSVMEFVRRRSRRKVL